MHPSLSLLHHLFIISMFLQSTALPDTPTMKACEPRMCGNLTITYPFWINGVHPSYCGNPSLEIDCRGGKPYLVDSYDTSYYMKHVFYENNSFVAISSILENVIGGCYIPEFNVSIGLGPFEISETNKVLLFFYDCTNIKPPSADYLHVTCNTNQSQSANESFVRLYENDKYGPGNLLSNCTISKRPVLGWNPQPVDQYMNLMKDGFLLELKVMSCEGCKASNGACGFNTSTSAFMCICSNGTTYPFSCPVNFKQETWLRSHRKMALIGLAIFAAALFSLACVLSIFKLHKSYVFSKQYNQLKKIEQRLGIYGSLALKRYRYRELKKITWSFREKLGKGGFGTVYKGCLSDSTLVAVKILHNSTSNVEQFLNEVASISRTSHVNVVNLLGFCFEGPKQALIYEYMSNGSLDSYIYSDDATTTLGWEQLYEIAIGIARGLEYLHQGCNTHIVHFDIKPQNILLDEDFRPKIADFGLAKLCPPKESIISMAEMRGTIGFIAPEIFSRSFGVVSTKSDVYSFGMMLLEIVGGRRNVKPSVDNLSQEYFPHWIYHCLLQGGEIQIGDVTPVTEEIARKMALVGLWCIQTIPHNRPSMGRVVEMLERDIRDLEMPPKPYLDSASGFMPLPMDCTCTSTTSSHTQYPPMVSPEKSALIQKLSSERRN
ncbi:hypothetical protein LUZ61_004553 [Rhynchospora tenuis]|uniref:non-specific serine/threonine protein kinase n=1 Tax=Rhynchospora tenuis TaxID=198213 RepID=A0AAD5ZN27_9POAL|nr:hypothetical protein LUZ61_004553 [Rhynchospora tenuis]